MPSETYVNIQAEECNMTAIQLNQIHSDIQEKVKVLTDKIGQLSDVEGGFYINKISNKIHDLLECLENDIMNELYNTYEDSEKGLDSYITNIMDRDMSD